MADHDIHDRLSKIVGLLTRGEASAAEKQAQHCTMFFPDAPEGWFLLGAARHRQGRYSDALSAFERALALNPHHRQALQAKAAVFFDTGSWGEMLAACELAAALTPADAAVAANLGTALEKLDRLDEALQQFDRALALDSRQLNAMLNRGALLLRMRRAEDALANNRHLAEVHPGFAEAHYNLGDVLLTLHRYEEALAACEAGLVVAPRHARLCLKRAVALACLCRFAEAQADLAQAQILEPGLLSELIPATEKLPAAIDPYANAELIYLEAHLKAQQDCNWHRRDEFLAMLERFIVETPPSGIALHDKKLALPLLSMPHAPEVRLKAMVQISEFVQDTAWLYGIPPFKHEARKRERIRVGYVSPDFRDHSVGQLSMPLYRLHDRTRFEIHCYSLKKDTHDPVQQEIAARCDHWHDVAHLSAAAIAQKIHADGIDILIDLAGFRQDSRPEAFALRPAPVQAHYLGYPGSMGAEFMDYAIADQVVCPPDDEQFVTEEVVLLPNAYCPYDTTTQNLPTSLTRQEAGLPEHGIVFCCFSASHKIEPTAFALWLRLLRQIPDSVLWLVSHQANVMANLQREAERQGIDSTRLFFAPHLPREQHLQRVQLADIFLDTRWHNALSIAADALWQGLPVLTCSGPHWSSRLTASLLHAVGLPELIAPSLEAYETLALDLATNRERLAGIKEKLLLARNSAPLFSPETTVRNLEKAYEKMWNRWRAAG
ncbi:MAG TPA: tetratricopeptide repeat protein [Methylophilaceae bacterium]|jgi:protein O-GlcNAc transferase|nr:tetratricopeptide repeat protein [Methylophilaceae bacterium]